MEFFGVYIYIIYIELEHNKIRDKVDKDAIILVLAEHFVSTNTIPRIINFI